jgi:hypothetical protein
LRLKTSSLKIVLPSSRGGITSQKINSAELPAEKISRQ